MINSSLKVYGSIWYFSVFCFVGFLFCLCMVRETRGLTDVQKKTLYSPKAVEHDESIVMTNVVKNDN